jgi:hypothetical protein
MAAQVRREPVVHHDLIAVSLPARRAEPVGRVVGHEETEVVLAGPAVGVVVAKGVELGGMEVDAALPGLIAQMEKRGVEAHDADRGVSGLKGRGQVAGEYPAALSVASPVRVAVAPAREPARVGRERAFYGVQVRAPMSRVPEDVFAQRRIVGPRGEGAHDRIVLARPLQVVVARSRDQDGVGPELRQSRP